MHRLIQYYIHKSRELHAWRVLVVWTEWHRQGRRGIADRTKEPAEIYHQRHHRGHGIVAVVVTRAGVEER